MGHDLGMICSWRALRRGGLHLTSWAFAATLAVAPLMPAGASSAERPILVATLDGAVTPISATYITGAIETAESRNAELFVLELDTPGGLVESMKEIVQTMLNSPVPVAVFVTPSGASAGSAGAFITLAAHVAAMSPGTNIGAAHPVAMGGAEMDDVMREKLENDAVSYIRTIAETRGRNPNWAERAVLESISSTEVEALEEGVVDLIADDLPALLHEVDGYEVDLHGGRSVVLATADAPVHRIPMSWQERALFVLSQPTVAYLLGLLGAYGIMFELWNPGALFPAIVGSICILLAAIGFHIIPVTWVGLGLMAVAIIFFVLETQIASHGALTIGGLVALVAGSVVLIDVPSLALPLFSVILPAALLTAAFFLFVVGFGLKAQRGQVRTGAEGLAGARARVCAAEGRDYRVSVHGEIWFARAEQTLAVGDPVRVVEVDGMTLGVVPDP